MLESERVRGSLGDYRLSKAGYRDSGIYTTQTRSRGPARGIYRKNLSLGPPLVVGRGKQKLAVGPVCQSCEVLLGSTCTGTLAPRSSRVIGVIIRRPKDV